MECLNILSGKLFDYLYFINISLNYQHHVANCIHEPTPYQSKGLVQEEHNSGNLDFEKTPKRNLVTEEQHN